MKILVFSDTHGMTASAVEAVRNHPDADEIIHLGDNIRDAYEIQKLTGIAVTCVKGNCDFSSDPEKLVITREGCRIFLTHGHKYSVGYSLLRLCLAAEEAGAHAAFFGHTHVPVLEYENGILLLNPGSISNPRGSSKRCYAVLDVKNGFIRPNIETVM